MQTKPMTARTFIQLGVCALLALGTLQLRAEDKKADPTGTWSWTQAGRNGGPDRTNSLALKLEGEKVTGKLTSPGFQGGSPTETAIEDGKMKADEVSFSVTRDFNGNKMVSKYSGKVTADTITGKIDMDRGDGNTSSRDWTAKKQAAAPAPEKK
jgi:hypothetical protein